MRAVTRLFGIAAAGVLVAGSVQAQTCFGFTPFDAASMNVSALIQSGNDVTSYGGQLNASNSAFGGSTIHVGVTLNTFDAPPGVDDNNWTLGGGLLLNKRTSTGLEWCPGANFFYTTGDFDVSTLAAGVSLGKALDPSGGLTLVPFGTIAFVMHNYDGGDDQGLLFGGGLGLRLTNGMQITPSLWKDASIDDSDINIRVTVTWPLGKKM
jgi:hypothetical protein